jgi:acyl carrier protein
MPPAGDVTGNPVLARLLEVVVSVAGDRPLPADLGAHTAIAANGLELDSIAILELLLGCEVAFDITFDPVVDFSEDALRTLGTLAASVDRALAASGGSR